MFTLNCKGKLVSLKKPLVMGILNLTSDSFYEGSRLMNEGNMLQKADQMITEGVDILDIGAQSTRPKSIRVSATEEWSKVLPALKILQEKYPETLISIDTYHAEVAEKAAEQGAHLINDISGGNMDKNMIPTVAAAGIPYICMHMKGTPENMQELKQYKDVVQEVLQYFIERTETCKEAGIKDVIIDPGFGFAKNTVQNFELLKNLSLFSILNKPIMVGVSRKSSIYKTLGITAEEALNGTTVLNTLALKNGANILRVHDVREAVEAVKLVGMEV